MKIILTGATGFVGAEVLTRLIDHQRVDQVTCLTRRPLATTSPKVRTIFQEDFTTYDQARLDELADHSACIWALGGKASDLGEPEVFTRITHTFTLTLASGMAANARDRFSFCYLSGMGADSSESARLPWERLTRHLKGRTEKDLGLLQDANPAFCVHSFRPGGILPTTASPILRALTAPIAIGVGELADAMVDAGTDPALFGRWRMLPNHRIKQLAHGRLPGDDGRSLAASAIMSAWQGGLDDRRPGRGRSDSWAPPS